MQFESAVKHDPAVDRWFFAERAPGVSLPDVPLLRTQFGLTDG